MLESRALARGPGAIRHRDRRRFSAREGVISRGWFRWGGSSAGRASRSQCEGRGFDPLPLHISLPTRTYAGSGLGRVDQSPRPESGQYFVETRVRDGEAAFTAPGHAPVPDHILTHVPRAVHDDRPRGRVAVSGIEALETYGMAVGTEIGGIGSISAGGGGVRTRLIG